MKIYFNIKANDGNKRRQTTDKRRPVLHLFICITFKGFVLLYWISRSFTDTLGLL